MSVAFAQEKSPVKLDSCFPKGPFAMNASPDVRFQLLLQERKSSASVEIIKKDPGPNDESASSACRAYCYEDLHFIVAPVVKVPNKCSTRRRSNRIVFVTNPAVRLVAEKCVCPRDSEFAANSTNAAIRFRHGRSKNIASSFLCGNDDPEANEVTDFSPMDLSVRRTFVDRYMLRRFQISNILEASRRLTQTSCSLH